jgi:hypothetical protein
MLTLGDYRKLVAETNAAMQHFGATQEWRDSFKMRDDDLYYCIMEDNQVAAEIVGMLHDDTLLSSSSAKAFEDLKSFLDQHPLKAPAHLL